MQLLDTRFLLEKIINTQVISYSHSSVDRLLCALCIDVRIYEFTIKSRKKGSRWLVNSYLIQCQFSEC